ncbi:MAG: hypothetical protein FJW39_09725 [Acidobacteria bacterium]|nr:hypothetical protein [Acidobacteriota bacterium]
MRYLAILAALPIFAAPKIEGPFAARDGETCVVCNTRLTKDDVAFLIDGQRLAVMREMREELLREPLVYLARYKPEGMLFTGRQPVAMGAGYLWVGTWVLLAIVSGALCSYLAMNRGLAPSKWFFAGLAFPPAVVGLMFKPRAAVPAGLAKIASTRDPAACPACGSLNHPAATACLRCGAAMIPTARAETVP